MTKRARVIAAIEHKDTDGIPSSFSLHFPTNQAFGEEAVKAHLDFFKETDTDIIKIMNEYLIPSCGFIATPFDYYEKISQIDIKTSCIVKQIEMAKRIIDKADKNVFSMGTLHGICASGIHPLERMDNGYSFSEARQMQVDFLRWNESKMLSVMQQIVDGMCLLAQKYIKEVGLDAVYYAALGGERRWFTDEEFSNWIKPFDLQIMRAIKNAGGYCFLHICKSDLNMERYDTDYTDLADVVNWSVAEAPLSLAEGKLLFPGKTILGGLRNRSGVLVSGKEDRVKQEVKNIIADFGRRGFILGADCTLATEQNLRLVRAAVMEARNL